MQARIDEDERADPEHDRVSATRSDQRAGQPSPDPSRPAHRVSP